MSEWKQYRKRQLAEMRPYERGEDMTGISVGEEDAKKGSPKAGDMIARNASNPKDQWLVSEVFFKANYIEVERTER